jgi:NADH-quinone oxidoreductase subunit A
MSPLAAYVLLFVAVGAGFIFVHLVAGWMIRPSKPDREKGTIYECGEPTIGSAWIQFDVRFYVVALLFVIFDVEVAFFFPWAEVFGKANAVANAPDPANDVEKTRAYARKVLDLALLPAQEEAREKVKDAALPRQFDNQKRYRQAANPETPPEEVTQLISEKDVKKDKDAARELAWMALGEVILFFGILLVGFAYLWRRGDLAWVRSVAAEQPPPTPAPPPSQAVTPSPATLTHV